MTATAAVLVSSVLLLFWRDSKAILLANDITLPAASSHVTSLDYIACLVTYFNEVACGDLSYSMAYYCDEDQSFVYSYSYSYSFFKTTTLVHSFSHSFSHDGQSFMYHDDDVKGSPTVIPTTVPTVAPTVLPSSSLPTALPTPIPTPLVYEEFIGEGALCDCLTTRFIELRS